MIIAVIFGCFQEKSVHKYINGCTISKENPFQTTRNPGLMLFNVARSAFYVWWLGVTVEV